MSPAAPSSRFARATARRQAHADYQPADADAAPDDADADSLETDIPEYEPIDDEMSELLDLGASADPDAGALGQLKGLYETAETVSQASLDRHFEQLLERQRELISEYFSEPGGPGPGRPTRRPATRPSRQSRSASTRRRAWPACAASCAAPSGPPRRGLSREDGKQHSGAASE